MCNQRREFQPAFHDPRTVEEAVQVIEAWGTPCVETFSRERAEKVGKILREAFSSPMPSTVVNPIIFELSRALKKFPEWPDDPLHAVGIVMEEAGELDKAVLQEMYEPEKQPRDAVRKEALQTAAMCIRFLASLDRYTWHQSPQHCQEVLKGV